MTFENKIRLDDARGLQQRRRFTGRWQSLLTASALVVCAMSSGQAATSDAEFEERVRTYILSNPELILEALEILSKRETRAVMRAKVSQYSDVFTETPALGIGPEDAPIRVVEFFDYRCAPCKVLHPILKEELTAHPSIRVEMRQLPILSPGSERGARFALAVKSLADVSLYNAVHEDLWVLQGPLRDPAFQQIAQKHGLDWDAIKTEMGSDAITARISRNRDIAIDLEILGTPAFVTLNSVSFGQSDPSLLVKDWLSQ